MFIPRYPVHIDIAIQDGVPAWTEEAQVLHNKGAWVENALPLDVFNSKDVNLRALTNRIFDEVKESSIKKFKSPHRAKQSLKMVLINLWTANLMGAPVRYSRSRNDYVHDSRYGQLFFRFDTLIPVIDALKKLGYIEQKLGRSTFEDKDKGYQTRMWATPKLIGLFTGYRIITPDFKEKLEPEELIVLNKDVPVKSRKKSKKIKIKKVEVKYTDNKQTKAMRNDLERYRDFVKQQLITVCIPCDELINYQFLFDLYRNMLNGRNTLQSVIYSNGINKGIDIDIDNLSLFTDNNKTIINRNIDILYRNTEVMLSQPYPITNMFRCKEATDKDLHRLMCFDWIWEFVGFLSKKYREMATERKSHNKSLYQEFALRDIDIEQLIFSLNKEVLYRVFNKENSYFKYGGRAFGATYQTLPKNIRKHILINNEQTIEVDFSAYHIRMLYHILGIDYRDDPYIKCGGEEYRKAFKCASLVIINAKDEEDAIGAINDQLSKNKIQLPKVNNPLKWMVNRFKEAHQPIAEFICSDYGVILQNIDSHIMNGILMSLMDKNILGLSMFDSIIVAKQHEDVLRETMTKEYEKVMGFKPVF